MNFAFALRTELMLNVRLFSADIDLVNFTMLLPMVETEAVVGPVTLLFEGTSNFKAFASLRKSGEEQGEEEVGESGEEASVEVDEEEDIVWELKLGRWSSLGNNFGDAEGDDVDEGVGGTEESSSDIVARLFLIRPILSLATQVCPVFFFVSLLFCHFLF